MKAVLLDFNGTMFFDTRFHMQAWSEIYRELHPEATEPLDPRLICGPRNEVILQGMAFLMEKVTFGESHFTLW